MLTEPQLEAALLVAKGRKTIAQIAQEVGTKPRTLDMWKATQEFKDRVEHHLKEWAREIDKKGIADRRRRIFRQNDRWRRLQAVIESRALEMMTAAGELPALRERQAEVEGHNAVEMARSAKDEDYLPMLWTHVPLCDLQDVPAYALTGLMSRKKVSVHVGEKEYDVQWEYQVDKGVLDALLDLEERAAEELGQKKQIFRMEEEDDLAAKLASIMPREELETLLERIERYESTQRAPGSTHRTEDGNGGAHSGIYREIGEKPRPEGDGDPGPGEGGEELP